MKKLFLLALFGLIAFAGVAQNDAYRARLFYNNSPTAVMKIDTNHKIGIDSVNIPGQSLWKNGVGIEGFISFHVDTNLNFYFSLKSGYPMDSSLTEFTYDSCFALNGSHLKYANGYIVYRLIRVSATVASLYVSEQLANSVNVNYHCYLKYTNFSTGQTLYIYTRQKLWHKQNLTYNSNTVYYLY